MKKLRKFEFQMMDGSSVLAEYAIDRIHTFIVTAVYEKIHKLQFVGAQGDVLVYREVHMEIRKVRICPVCKLREIKTRAGKACSICGSEKYRQKMHRIMVMQKKRVDRPE